MKKMSMSMKIYSVLGIIVLVAAVVAFVGISKMAGLNDRLNAIVDGPAEKVKLGAFIGQDLLTISRAEKNMILADSQEKMDVFAKLIDEIDKDMSTKRENLRSLVDDEGKKVLDQFKSVWGKYIEINKEVRRLARLNSNVRAKNLSSGEGRITYDQAAAKIEAIVLKNEQDMDGLTESSQLIDAAQKIKLAARINRNLVEIQRGEKNIILATSQEEMDTYAKAIDLVRNDLKERVDALSKLVDQQRLQVLKNFENDYQKYLDQHTKVLELSRENGNAQAFALASGKGWELADEAEMILEQIVEKNNKDMEQDKIQSDANYGSAKMIMLLVSIIGILSAAMASVFIMTGVNRGLRLRVGK
jgi:methyl-accepting chemotaxis protein